ncbi:low-specificity L-threonine aldolase [Deltaproteobacteria bacterium OttesenSCG-928-K17]|nr:low-specificity L-threonine aldolase [Deltaproteobacteria bacterium OttesenSCG-928-K17]
MIDFRSDTVTRPTPAMRAAMSAAEVGDDVYGDDPTVNRLEEAAAGLLGKEAAIFVPTGTMGNQAAIMAWTRPGQEIICGGASHIQVNEAGGAARLSGVGCAPLAPANLTSAADIQGLIRPSGDVHYPRSRLVCLENALGCGRVIPLAAMRGIYEAAGQAGLKVHLDGARLFNAAVALGVPAADLAACVDSVSFCLSKGLCAPVGSLICGPADFIAEARRCRKVLGGGMRQAGVLAACGLTALESMIERLAEDHENARYLGRLLADIPGVSVDIEDIEINMVFWRTERDFQDRALQDFMAEAGIKIGGRSGGRFRLVTHHDISRADIELLAGRLKSWMAQRN